MTTLTQTDWTLLMEKLDAIDKRLNTLEKEVKELKPSYTPPTIEDVQKTWDEITNPKYVAGKIPCMFEAIPPDQRNKPLGLVCRCPKCSPYCMGFGTFAAKLDDLPREWRLSTVNEDVEE